ncbi:histidine kinase dimerization/phospho-acceptor domain-containing protein [Bacillus sp. CGMCC 1.16607]|uniref:sensor histidine kinase n=1 Tax=Bacillus sp. CGMCC 1.16607 TaxID=3351842 RepID=UPI0036362357
MVTKSKNKIITSIWAFLFTIGLSGLLALYTYGSEYIHRDYSKSYVFQDSIYQFVGYLSMFELDSPTLDEVKKTLTVSESEINEHRYRYGTLPEQIANIQSQYEERIQGALDTENKEAAKAFTTERDTKIEDITKNFQSDDHVRPKVMKEKEQRLEEYYQARENYNYDFKRYKDAFSYYLKDSATGKVFTNLKLPEAESAEAIENQNNMLFITNYSITKDNFLHFGPTGYEDLFEPFMQKKDGAFEGKIALAKEVSSSNWIMTEYKNYKQKQIILIVYSISSIIALLLCFFLARKSKAISAVVEEWRPHYNKLPVDSRVVFFIITGIAAILILFFVNTQILDVLYIPFDAVESLFFLVIGSFFLALTVAQWKYLVPELKNWQYVKEEWEKGILYKAGKSTKVLFTKVLLALKEAFLNQSTGTQVFMILTIVFSLGFAAIMVTVDPFFLLFYLILLGVIGIPIMMVLIKKVGYFNRIVQKTNELVVGNLGEDLQVSGDSVLATLASNINLLKQGVKTSQNEQAKSERLKTELITNVSHDLRTPLTSIITYTELLKSEDLSREDRSAYLEIIDRKSQRLKVLIEDLFEVSKMASGNMELTKEKVDLVQLLQQALAEHDNTITSSTLQFRVTTDEKPIYVMVDGQKLWRVFDNLIGNILNYSLENSRVYISVSVSNDKALIYFKNVSKYELNDQSEELFERFKRGDTSRHTEGSGLGLAIAKSIVDLHEGSLDIETDGDLFKVCISLRIEG